MATAAVPFVGAPGHEGESPLQSVFLIGPCEGVGQPCYQQERPATHSTTVRNVDGARLGPPHGSERRGGAMGRVIEVVSWRGQRRQKSG
eukprot:scaffold947_cov375-Prasinococcus_capsulatus_cf.AAC.15